MQIRIKVGTAKYIVLHIILGKTRFLRLTPSRTRIIQQLNSSAQISLAVTITWHPCLLEMARYIVLHIMLTMYSRLTHMPEEMIKEQILILWVIQPLKSLVRPYLVLKNIGHPFMQIQIKVGTARYIVLHMDTMVVLTRFLRLHQVQIIQMHQ